MYSDKHPTGDIFRKRIGFLSWAKVTGFTWPGVKEIYVSPDVHRLDAAVVRESGMVEHYIFNYDRMTEECGFDHTLIGLLQCAEGDYVEHFHTGDLRVPDDLWGGYSGKHIRADFPIPEEEEEWDN
jgi:hypothetical protein